MTATDFTRTAGLYLSLLGLALGEACATPSAQSPHVAFSRSSMNELRITLSRLKESDDSIAFLAEVKNLGSGDFRLLFDSRRGPDGSSGCANSVAVCGSTDICRSYATTASTIELHTEFPIACMTRPSIALLAPEESGYLAIYLARKSVCALIAEVPSEVRHLNIAFSAHEVDSDLRCTGKVFSLSGDVNLNQAEATQMCGTP